MTGQRLLGLGGTARIQITGACPEELLGLISGCGIRFRCYEKKDPVTAMVTVPLGELDRIRQAGRRCMCQVAVLEERGILSRILSMGWRVGYFLVLGAIVALVFFIQEHILFLGVEGNDTIPTEQVLQILEENGVGFWTRTDAIDINHLKNQVLAQIPELGFLTINTEGPVATVVLRQRQEKPVESHNPGPANLVAGRDGVVESVTVTGGTAQIAPGDVVHRGQLLISGVTNLDTVLVLSRAQGEVQARTFVAAKAVLPDVQYKKQYTGRKNTDFSISFGKNTINLLKSSRISYDNYDRMSVRKTLTLPGGYVLPFSVTMIQIREYELVACPVDEASSEALLTRAVETHTTQGLMAGMILGQELHLSHTDGSYCLGGVLECQEEITVSVEIKE